MKTRLILAGLALTAFSATPASAADFGGNCCADLEERIAELEATTARRGNRKVSLTIYGQVNEAIGFWDDGVESNQYVFTNDTSRTRFGFKGKAKINSDWYAGYKIEVGVRAADQGALDADIDTGGFGLDLRHSSWTIGSKTYGSLTMGQTSMAHDGITQNQTARIGHFANPDVLDANDSFNIRQSGTGADIGEWDNLAQNLEPGEGSRAQAIRYDSPAFAGFTMHAHWGEDDIWGAALKYAGEFGDFKAAAGIGYGEMSERDEECLSETDIENISGGGVGHGSQCREMGLSGSIMHNPTGLFVTGAYGIRWDEGRRDALIAGGFAADAGAGDLEELKMYHIQAGIEQKWVSLGKTTLFGGYQKREAGYAVRDGRDAGDNNFNRFNGNRITNFEFDMWEFGLNQQISAAEMDIYLHYKHYDADITTTVGTVQAEPWQTVIMGSRIKF
jgi:hypothetical protein